MGVTSPQQRVCLRLGDYVSCDYLQAHRWYYDRCRRYVYLIITGGDMWTLSLVPTSSLIVALNRVFVFNTCNIQNRNSSLYFARFYIHSSVHLQQLLPMWIWLGFLPTKNVDIFYRPLWFAINHHHRLIAKPGEVASRSQKRTWPRSQEEHSTRPQALAGCSYLSPEKCNYKNKHTYRWK